MALAQIPCCLCGTLIEPNEANMCLNCLKEDFDFSADLEPAEEIIYCPECLRFRQTDTVWVPCEEESFELMQLCLRKIHGLSAFQLVDSTFIYKPLSSMRIPIRLIVRKEVDDVGVTLQQSVTVEFRVRKTTCPQCIREALGNTWETVVRVRQPSGRAFPYLEQILRERSAIIDLIIAMENHKEGVDFYFQAKQDATPFLDFLSSHFPIRASESVKRVSDDNMEFSTLVRLANVWKGDLVIPSTLGHPRLCFVRKVSSSIHLIDVVSQERFTLSSVRYFRNELALLMTPVEASTLDCIVLDVESRQAERELYREHKDEEEGEEEGETQDWVLTLMIEETGAEVEVRSHLGRFLDPGDTVRCYDLRGVFERQREREGGEEDEEEDDDDDLVSTLLQQQEADSVDVGSSQSNAFEEKAGDVIGFWERVRNYDSAQKKRRKKRKPRGGRKAKKRQQEQQDSSDEDEGKEEEDRARTDKAEEDRASYFEEIGRWVFPEVIPFKKL